MCEERKIGVGICTEGNGKYCSEKCQRRIQWFEKFYCENAEIAGIPLKKYKDKILRPQWCKDSEI